MSAKLEIFSPGMMATIQDKGRFGYQSQGITAAGAMDLQALRIANRLVGNDPYEIFSSPEYTKLRQVTVYAIHILNHPINISVCVEYFGALSPECFLSQIR